MKVVRWVARGALALPTLAMLTWVVLGASSLAGAILGTLSVAMVAFVAAELAGLWPVTHPKALRSARSQEMSYLTRRHR